MKITFSVLPSENMNTSEYLFLKKEANLSHISNNDFKHIIYIFIIIWNFKQFYNKKNGFVI